MTSQPAPGERYQSFSAFYPYYIHEHSNRTCRRIHIVGSALVLVIVAVGALARRVVGQRLLAWFEGLIARIPLLKTVYGSARKLLDLLQTKPDGTQRVVLIDFPHREMKCVGFVTRVMREQGTGRELAAVYVPTTPNPTSGYLEIVPVDRLTPTDWTVDEAMAFIVSGGAIALSMSTRFARLSR